MANEQCRAAFHAARTRFNRVGNAPRVTSDLAPRGV